MRLSLAASAPDALQQTISLCQSVQGIVALSHRSNETAKGVNLALACESTVLINLSDGDLDGCVILGLDDSVGGAALSWDVAVCVKLWLAKKVLQNDPAGHCRNVIFCAFAGRHQGFERERTDLRVLPCRSPCLLI